VQTALASLRTCRTWSSSVGTRWSLPCLEHPELGCAQRSHWPQGKQTWSARFGGFRDKLRQVSHFYISFFSPTRLIFCITPRKRLLNLPRALLDPSFLCSSSGNQPLWCSNTQTWWSIELHFENGSRHDMRQANRSPP